MTRLALHKSLIELSVCRMDQCQTWNDWNFLEKLEKAEGRIVALEKQVKHSAALFHFLEVWRFALSDMS